MKKKTKTVTLPEDTALAVLTDKERLIIEKFKERMNRRVQFKDGLPVAVEGKPKLLSFSSMMETCQATSAMGALQLITNAAAGQYWDSFDTCLAVAHVQIEDLAPQSPLEAMLISQMVAVNTAIGKLMTRGMSSGQTFEGKQMNMNLATKLQRTFLQQTEALQKLRSKVQQTVTVEHVTVNSGGQAIVGHVEQRLGGRGKDEK